MKCNKSELNVKDSRDVLSSAAILSKLGYYRSVSNIDREEKKETFCECAAWSL